MPGREARFVSQSREALADLEEAHPTSVLCGELSVR
jgi:hypothetical protein